MRIIGDELVVVVKEGQGQRCSAREFLANSAGVGPHMLPVQTDRGLQDLPIVVVDDVEKTGETRRRVEIGT